MRLQGGMGNQMFQYAFARSLSIQKGTDLQMDLRYLLDRSPRKKFVFRGYDLDILNVQESFFKQGRKLLPYQVQAEVIAIKALKKMPQYLKENTLRQTYIEPYSHFDALYTAVAKNCYCIGYFQSYKYFHHIHDLLLQEFSLKPQFIEHKSSELYKKIYDSNSVCINVRRTDFITNKAYEVVLEKYYETALDILLQKQANLNLFVFSDDIEWCYSNLKFNLPTVYVSDEHAGERFSNKFNLMVSCKHFIIPNSTYAWWAAYLSNNANKSIIAPTSWITNREVNELYVNDLIPESWIKI